MTVFEFNRATPGKEPPPEEVVFSAGEPPFVLSPKTVPAAQLASSFQRLVLLYRLGHHICSEEDPQKIFDTIVEAISKLLEVERAFIATLHGQRLLPRATYGLVLAGDPDKWPVSTTMLRRVLEEGVSILATDALHDAKYGKVPSVDLHNIRSVMCCLLGVPRRPRGLVYVDNRLTSGAFSRLDLEFLMALTHYALLAIEMSEKRQHIVAEKELAEARWETLRKEGSAGEQLVARSRSMAELCEQARRIARSSVPVMIVGETGTGKEVLAKLIHESSSRSRGPFVPVHVAAFSRSVLESELFGHEKGAFTGALQRRMGRFELARGGTLFLDEILDIPLDIQPKLLRVLEKQQFERVGGTTPVSSDVRIISACNRPPEKEVAAGRFREDLFYRLNAVTLVIPPLRKRSDDIRALVEHFLERCGGRKLIDDEAMAALMRYRWPGNVRELKNCIEALHALVEGTLIRAGDLPARFHSESSPGECADSFAPLGAVIAAVEREHMRRALERAGGNNEKAIRLLGISRAKFFQRKREYGL